MTHFVLTAEEFPARMGWEMGAAGNAVQGELPDKQNCHLYLTA